MFSYTNTGWGRFYATNGWDELYARNFRTDKLPDGHVHGYWELTDGNKKYRVFGDKEQALNTAYHILMTPLKQPLTEVESEAMQERCGNVHGIIGVALCELYRSPKEVFQTANEMLSECTLHNMTIDAADIYDDGAMLALYVTGKI